MRARRRLVVLLPILALAILLTGCMHADRTLTIHADGSGTYTLSLGFREPTPGDRASVSQQIVTPLEAFGAHVVAAGGVLDRTEEHGYAYWNFSRPFTSVAAANALLQEDPRQDDPQHNPVLYADTLHVATERQVFGSAIHVSGTLSLVDAQHNAQAWKDATESLSITMDGGIGAHQGGTVEGDTISYSISYNQAVTVDVTGQTTGQLAFVASDVPLIVAGVLVLVMLLLLALAANLLRTAWSK